MREHHTLKGHVEAWTKLKGLDEIAMQQAYTLWFLYCKDDFFEKKSWNSNWIVPRKVEDLQPIFKILLIRF